MHAQVGMGCSGDARFCVSTGGICVCWQNIIAWRNQTYRIPPFTIQPAICFTEEKRKLYRGNSEKERTVCIKLRKPHRRLFHNPVTKPPPPDGRMPLAYREQLFSVHEHAERTTRMYSDASVYGREWCAIMYISHYQYITTTIHPTLLRTAGMRQRHYGKY